MAINTAINNILSNQAVDAVNEHLDEDYFDLVQRNNPLQKIFEDSTHGGLDIQTVLGTSQGNAVGADVDSVITNADDVSRGAFRTPWAEGIAVGQVRNTDIDLMGDDENSVVDALVDSTSKKMRALATRIERHLAGDGFGTQFIIASHTGGASPYVLTATRPTDLANIQVNDKLVSSVAKNSASLDTGTMTVTHINRDAGTVTVTTADAWDGTANDAHFVFQKYDKKAGSLTKALCGLGLDFWIPLDAPTADETTICGMDRRTDTQNLAGARSDGRNKSLWAEVIKMLSKLSVNGEAMPDRLAVNSVSGWSSLVNSAPPNALTKEPNGGEFEYGFEVMSFQGPTGKVKVFPCWAIREDRVYVLSSSTWKLHKPKKDLIFTDARAGRNGLIDSYNASAVQFRKKSIYGLTCAFPGANGVIRTA
jgi:hypothetical protein